MGRIIPVLNSIARLPEAVTLEPRLAGLPFDRVNVIEKWQKMFGSDLIGLWAGNEPSGTVAYDHSGRNHHGVHVGVTLGQPGIEGLTCPLYDGVNDYTNVLSPGLSGVFSTQTGTLIAWFKMSAVGIWSDGLAHDIAIFRADVNNVIGWTKRVPNNTLGAWYSAGGVNKLISAVVTPSLDGYWVAQVWDKPNDSHTAYLGAASQGTLNGLGVWSGALTTANIGAQQDGTVEPWNGLLGPIGLLKRAAVPREIAEAVRF